MMSGLREAVRIVDILENRGDTTSEAEALAAAQRQSDSERNEVQHLMTRKSLIFCASFFDCNVSF
jgi:lysine-specific histone demethylase 1